jgi:hypothetical protein
MESTFKPLISYICGVSSEILQVDSSVEIEIRTSTLSSGFIKGKHRGLFTKKFLPAKTIISEVDMNNLCMMNDGLVDLEAILRAQTSRQLYDALQQLYESYYDIEKAKQVINVRMVIDSQSSKKYYQTIQDIPMDGELFRAYGFTSWIFELSEILTHHNLIGFAKFVRELKDQISGDPLEFKVYHLDQILSELIPNLDSVVI